MAMLPTDHVAQIKRYLQKGYRVGELADAFSVGRKAISKIKAGRTHTRVRPALSVPDLDKAAAKVKRMSTCNGVSPWGDSWER